MYKIKTFRDEILLVTEIQVNKWLRENDINVISSNIAVESWRGSSSVKVFYVILIHYEE